MRFAGVLFIMMAAVGWGLSGGIGNILMDRGWDPIVISFYRGAIGLVFFIVWFFASASPKKAATPRFYIWSVLAGIGVAGNFSFYFLSIQASTVAVAATLMYTAPVFVLLISFVIGFERSTLFKWGCIFFVLCGIVLITGAYNPGALETSTLGIVTGLAAGLSYTLFIFGFKNASPFGNPQTTLSIAFFVFCVVLFMIADKEQVAAVLTSGDIGWFVLLGIVGAGVSFIFYLFGIRLTTPSTAAMVAMVEPVTASLFGVLLLGDYLSVIQLTGMAVILGTVTVLSRRQS
ncbi:DMT family transporter [Bacillus daqingensis]|uniref:DMT family transporter n=1 Tax=Bacillus daqingensis TaxID=872396 RepID=A0ABV9NQN7_9BACI